MATSRDALDVEHADLLRDWWPGLPWHEAVETHGAFHRVVFAGDAVVRVLRGADHERRAAAQGVAWEEFAGAAPDVPAARLKDLRQGLGVSALVVSRIEGPTWVAGSWEDDRRVWMPLLESLWAAAVPGVGPRTWCGAQRWSELVDELGSERCSPWREAATRLAREVDEHPEGPEVLTHGDLGPHNLVASRSGPVLIDLDHVCKGERAIDVAHLLASYPARALTGDLGADLVRRARLVRCSLSLQVAVAARLHGDRELEAHAWGNAERRLAGLARSSTRAVR